MITLFGGMI